jgi:tetratricopeptide (TPR) repeat protein
LAKVEAAHKAEAAAKKPEEMATAARAFDEGIKVVQDAVKYHDTQTEQLKQKQPASEVLARMYYEAAWGYRTLAEAEIDAARTKLRQELLKKKQEEAAKKMAANQGANAPRSSDVISLPEVPLIAIPLQPAEKKTREHYQALVASFPDLSLTHEARFELAELLSQRSEHDAAVKLLNDALDKEPPVELTDRIRVRLGAAYAAKKDAKSALAQFEAVAQNPKSLLVGEAHYRAGECLLELGDAAAAVKHLALFRDQPPFQNLPGLTDRALLRLGHAYASLKQWEQSRQAHEQVVGRFGNSPWVHEARYGVGWAWQNLKQYDNAVNAYQQVTATTATETAAKAQLQIGLCRLEQKRHPEAANALLVVPFTYDYPEWNAVALCEAARAFSELKQTDHAEKLLKRVIRDHPESKWARVAKDRLETLR